MKKSVPRTVSVLAITIAIFFFIFTKIDFFSVVKVLSHANLFYLFIALLLLVIGVLIIAKRWRIILKYNGLSNPVPQVLHYRDGHTSPHLDYAIEIRRCYQSVLPKTVKQSAKISAVVITIVLVAILLSQIQIADVITTLAGIDPLYLAVGFVLYVCSYFFRALRFHILLNNKVSIKHLFSIVCVHNMANNILPARTGEISYVYLVKKLHNIPIGEGIVTLMVAKVFDFITISLLFFVSAVFIENLPSITAKAISFVAGLLILMLIVLFSFLYFGEKFMDVIGRLVNRNGVKNIRWVQYLLRKASETVQSFNEIKSKRTIVTAILASIVLWIFTYSIIFTFVKGMQLQLGFLEMVLAFTFLTAINTLPLRNVAGFGTTEGAWTLVLMGFNIPMTTAIATGFGVHILLLGYIIIFGFFGLVLIKSD